MTTKNKTDIELLTEAVDHLNQVRNRLTVVGHRHEKGHPRNEKMRDLMEGVNRVMRELNGYLLEADYTPVIHKGALLHGAYYRGRCRNATVARWDGNREVFLYWRYKLGREFLEKIHPPEDDNEFDVFIAEEEIPTPEKEIPFKLHDICREGDEPPERE